jgi:hypothetical protein
LSARTAAGNLWSRDNANHHLLTLIWHIMLVNTSTDFCHCINIMKIWWQHQDQAAQHHHHHHQQDELTCINSGWLNNSMSSSVALLGWLLDPTTTSPGSLSPNEAAWRRSWGA